MPVTVGGTSVTFNDSSSQGTAYVGANSQAFGSSGTFTVPAGVTKLIVTVISGAGGGQGGYLFSTGAAGGNGGLGKALITGLTPGANISVTVGSGGNGGAAQGTNGTSGGTSSFGSYITCTGGAGGGTGSTFGEPTFSGVATILNKSVSGGTVDFTNATSVALGMGLKGSSGAGNFCASEFGGGAGGGACGGGGAGGNATSTTAASGGLAYGNGQNGSNSAGGVQAAAGASGGGNGVASNGGSGAAGSGTQFGGGGGGGGGFVLVQW